MNETLQAANQSLEEEIAERQRVERALKQAKTELEFKVMERTAELHEVNQQLQQELGERNRAEKELKFSNTMLATEQEVSPDGILAVDEALRVFCVCSYINEILTILTVKLKKSGHVVNVQCDASITIDGYPGAFAQILTNLVLNSLVHAYDAGDTGRIDIQVERSGST